MPRLSHALSAVLAMALLGCGGGGGKKNNNGGTTPPVLNLNTGLVRTPDNVVLTGAKVTFYNSSGTALSTTTVQSTGYFGAAPPAGATRFGIDVTNLTSGGAEIYYDTFAYGDAYYDANVGCYPPLPSGGFTSDIVFFVRSSGQVPPPPNGCLG